jgi:hypothetical protein
VKQVQVVAVVSSACQASSWPLTLTLSAVARQDGELIRKILLPDGRPNGAVGEPVDGIGSRIIHR